MKKRDRTSQEKAFDDMIRAGIAHLGQTPTAPAEPNLYRHVLKWDRLGRQGQSCRILKQRGTLAQIEFESDKFVTRINRMAIRRS
jgi:hypothetical protein